MASIKNTFQRVSLWALSILVCSGYGSIFGKKQKKAYEEQDARILNALDIITNLEESLPKILQAGDKLDVAMQKEALKNQNMVGIDVKNNTIQSQFEELIQLEQEGYEILKSLFHPGDKSNLAVYDYIPNYTTRLLKNSQKKLLSFSPDSQKVCEPF